MNKITFLVHYTEQIVIHDKKRHNMPKDPNLGRRICSRMSQTRLTVRHIANELNVSTGTVSAWRDGRHISSKYLSHLCDLLQVTESWLLRGLEKKEHLQCDEEFLIHMYRKMTEEQRTLITMTSQEFTKSA